MGLTKSPAGVPWSLPIDMFVQEEVRYYTDKLTTEWASDARRVTVLREAGLSTDQIRPAMKIGATGLWGFLADSLAAQNPKPEGRSVRRVAGLHKQAYIEAQRMPFGEWSGYMQEAIVSMITGDDDG